MVNEKTPLLPPIPKKNDSDNDDESISSKEEEDDGNHNQHSEVGGVGGRLLLERVISNTSSGRHPSSSEGRTTPMVPPAHVSWDEDSVRESMRELLHIRRQSLTDSDKQLPHVESGDGEEDEHGGEDEGSDLEASSTTSPSRRPARRARSDSGGSVLEYALESISEMKEHVIEEIAEIKVALADTAEHMMEEITEVIHEEVGKPVKPREEGEHTEKLSTLALAVLVFYKVSGGPFGCEPTVKAGGPLYAMLGFIIFPFLWSIPEALITAELGAAYPEPSGAVAWVEEAFGAKAGLLCGYFHWLAGATDNAIYPSLFLHYFASYIHQEELFGKTSVRFVFTIAITTILSIINWTGLEIVGNLSIVIAAISMFPFLFLFAMSFSTFDISRWFVLPQAGASTDDDRPYDGLIPDPVFAGVLWRPLLNNLFWNMNSFDAGASFAGEIRDPERVFPRAMFLSVVFVSLAYVLPVGAALGALDTRQEDWNAGYFTNVAEAIGGKWLAVLTLLGSAVSNIGLFEAEMSGDAYQLMGMADRGMIPKLFTKRSRFGTPENGILLGTFVIYAMSVADFDALVEMLNFAYGLSMIMEFAAFIKLRISEPDVERPYRIPLNTVGCVLFLLPPTIFLIYIMLIASRMTYIYFIMLLIFGAFVHALQKVAKHYHLVDYVEAPKRKKPATSSVSSSPEAGTGLMGL